MGNRLSLSLSLVVILLLGLTTIWSTVPSLFWIQFMFICLGVLIAVTLRKIDPRILAGFSWPMYIMTILLLLATLFFGQNIRGSSRWLVIGPLNLQPSELAKPFLAIFFADYIARNSLKTITSTITFLILASLPIYLIKIQPDLGSALVIAALALSHLFYSDFTRKYLVILPIAFIITLPFLSNFLHSYQLERLKSFVDPYHDPKGSGYNVIQSVIAIGSGGLIGKGVRLGTQSHLNFLPERHTDFIFASFSEEFGFLGIAILLSAYLIVLRLFVHLCTSLRHDPFLFHLSLSIFTVFGFQIVVNVGMNLGLLPVTGITLPMFSYGGSSMLTFFTLLGLSLGLLELVPRNRI